MRLIQLLVLALVLVFVSFSSCQCRKEVPPPEPAVVKEAEGGSRLAAAITAAPKLTPQPGEPSPVAEATPTFPAELPASFPKEVPVYEGSTLMRDNAMANDARNVIFSVRDSVQNVSAFYDKKMTGQGFAVTQQFHRDKQSFATYKKDNLLINVTIADDERSPGQQIIAIMYEYEKPLPFDEF